MKLNDTVTFRTDDGETEGRIMRFWANGRYVTVVTTSGRPRTFVRELAGVRVVATS
jgi:hypothetical protein